MSGDRTAGPPDPPGGEGLCRARLDRRIDVAQASDGSGPHFHELRQLLHIAAAVAPALLARHVLRIAASCTTATTTNTNTTAGAALPHRTPRAPEREPA